jgi:hypothetical protein
MVPYHEGQTTPVPLINKRTLVVVVFVCVPVLLVEPVTPPVLLFILPLFLAFLGAL